MSGYCNDCANTLCVCHVPQLHRVNVRNVDGFGRPKRFRPCCICGWDGLAWGTKAEANTRGVVHIDMMRLKAQGYTLDQAEAIIRGQPPELHEGGQGS